MNIPAGKILTITLIVALAVFFCAPEIGRENAEKTRVVSQNSSNQTLAVYAIQSPLKIESASFKSGIIIAQAEPAATLSINQPVHWPDLRVISLNPSGVSITVEKPPQQNMVVVAVQKHYLFEAPGVFQQDAGSESSRSVIFASSGDGTSTMPRTASTGLSSVGQGGKIFANIDYSDFDNSPAVLVLLC